MNKKYEINELHAVLRFNAVPSRTIVKNDKCSRFSECSFVIDTQYQGRIEYAVEPRELGSNWSWPPKICRMF